MPRAREGGEVSEINHWLLVRAIAWGLIFGVPSIALIGWLGVTIAARKRAAEPQAKEGLR
jgi:hypothetical protein